MAIFSGGHNDVWASVAFYSLMDGIIGAVAAAVPGRIDFFSIDEAAMRKLGIYHMVCNSIALVIFGTGAWLRTTTAPGATLPIALSAVGVVFLGIRGWLGGEMVYMKGMAVQAVEVLANTSRWSKIRSCF